MPKYLKLRGASTSLNMESLVLIGASINKGYEKYPQRPIISMFGWIKRILLSRDDQGDKAVSVLWFTGS